MSVPARKGGAVGGFYQFGEDAGGCVGCSPVFVELRVRAHRSCCLFAYGGMLCTVCTLRDG